MTAPATLPAPYAVRQQRKPGTGAALDDFPTPPWATRALIRFLRGPLVQCLSICDVREPAANRGHMVRPLAEAFGRVIPSDVADYGHGWPVFDYLAPGPDIARAAWTITNPPFNRFDEFLARALDRSGVGVAMLLRQAVLEGQARHRAIWSITPPTDILQFTERCVMVAGRLLDPDVAVPLWSPKAGAMVVRKPSTASTYIWAVWHKPAMGRETRFHWTGECRRALTLPGDYPGGDGTGLARVGDA